MLRVGCAEESVVVDPNAHGRSRLVGVLPSLDWKHGHDCGIACTRDGGRLWLLVVDGGTRIQKFLANIVHARFVILDVNWLFIRCMYT